MRRHCCGFPEAAAGYGTDEGGSVQLYRVWFVSAAVFALLGCVGLPVEPGPIPSVAPPAPGVEVWTELAGNPLPLPTCPEWTCLGMTDPSLTTGPDGAVYLWFSAGGDQRPDGPVVGYAVQGADGSFSLVSTGPEWAGVDGGWDSRRETVSVHYEDGVWTGFYLGYNVSFFDDPAIGMVQSSTPDTLLATVSPAPIHRPAEGSWDAAFVSGPTRVIGPDGVWRVYYGGAGTTVGIGLLESRDAGATWTLHPDNPVFERDLDSWDQGLLEPTVIHDGTQYVMWYSGYEEPLDLQSTPISMGRATSPDGVTWTRSGSAPVLVPTGEAGVWNGLRVTSPSVLVEPDGSLLLAVHGQSAEDAQNQIPLGLIGLYRGVPTP
jgi:hypothetical protein